MFTRITKRAARKLWGIADIAFCPSNLRPGGIPFSSHVTFSASHVLPLIDDAGKFDKRVSCFEWWRCNKAEGRYTAFYLVSYLYENS